ncbi:MAG: chitobiase/beta-hexosaminidase C-terminal domain-containing protein [Muribaculaceae bacterium]|nr:chitobiase/beta-hexosaminidase C-terminal domain-containing protein [Muribaculaceae bacterium]
MKKLFTILTMALLFSASMWAKEADQIRIYLNPGHGSWTANDRPMGTMKHGDVKVDEEDSDTANFYETNTNLQKAFSFLNEMVKKGIKYDPTLNQPTEEELALGEKGIRRRGAALDMNNNIVMSHVHAGPYPTIKMGGDPELAEAFNRSLAEISLEVDANNFDYFISIHSNAATDGTSTNYPLVLYRGSDAEEQVPGSKALAQDVWPEAWRDQHAQWTYYAENNPNIRGDWSFYGSHSVGVNDADGYLGVLKHHAVGFLIEGYFHTYQPARHRYMNDDVAHQEGIRYARGFAKHLGLPLDEVGYIYGVVRNGHEVINEKYYKPNGATIDKFYPINDLTVTLKKDGETVATYTTDDEFNGAYVFGPLEPGTYNVSYSHPDFKDGVFVTEKGKVIEGKTEDEIVVTANATSFLSPLLERTDYVPPTEEPELYPDPVGKGGVAAAPRYNLKPRFEDVAIENLAGTTVRRTIQRGEKVFILAEDADNKPVIDVYNTKTGEVTPISVEGADANNISTTYLTLSDIQVTADGVLIAINKEKTQYNDSYVDAGETRGSLRVYKWEKDAETGLPTGNPALWLETNASAVSGNFYRAITGETFAYSGTSEDGVLTVSALTASGVKIRNAAINVAAGTLAGTSYYRPDGNNTTIMTSSNLGDNYNFIVSPINEDNMVVNSDNNAPLEFPLVSSALDTPITSTGNVSAEYGSSFFKYGNTAYMASPAADGLKLYNINDGIDKAKEVELGIATAAAPEPEPTAVRKADAAASTFATGAGIAVKNTDDEVIGGNLELVMLRGDKISVYTTEDEEQPVFYNSYAYDLQANLDLDAQLFSGSFKLLKQAPATVQILDPNTNEVLKEVEPVMDGVNGTFSVSTAEAPAGQSFTWAVKVENEGVPALAKIESGITPSARGIAIDNDPASPYFGHAVVTNPYAGANNHVLYALTPDHQSSTHTLGQWNASNTASPHRVNINPNNHKAYVADWSDAHAGVWIFDPANPDAEMVQMFEGTKGSGGEYTYEGTIIGGGGTGGAFWGTGADTRYYYFSEDCPTSNNSNVLVRYDIGENERVNFAPNAIYNNISGSSYMLNTDVNVVAASNGVFVSQNRTADQNTTGVPAFVYANLDGEVLFNSGNEDLMGNDLLSGIARGGLAISADEKTFAVSDAAGVVKIFDVAWNENVPSFTLKAEKAYGSVNHQMAFDYAGNLLLANQGNGVSFFAVPCDANEVVTPACKNFTLGEQAKLYILGEVGENGWAPNVGQEMTAGDPGKFSATITCDGRNDGYNYFSFTEKLAENADDWAGIADHRYGAEVNDIDVVLGEAMAIQKGENAFKIPAGEYEVAVDLNAMTATITATTVAAPVFNPEAGEYEESVEVTITAEEGAEIRYTIDGAEPTAESAQYIEPIVLNEIGTTTTIKAIAIRHEVASDVAEATYSVIAKPEPKPEMKLTKIWEVKTNGSPASSDARFATGFGEKVYVADRAAGEVKVYDTEGAKTFAAVEGIGVGITSDDAGNILVNKGFPDPTSFSSWVIIEPDGTQHELSLEAPEGIEAARTDQVGRIVGNVMSDEGGYMFLTPNGQTAVAAIKIVNGEQDVDNSLASPAVAALSTSYIAQPMFETVEDTEAYADPSAAFYLRLRTDPAMVKGWNEEATEQVDIATVGAGGEEGFDYFWFNNEMYAVAGTARTNEFHVKNLTTGEVAATNADDPVEAVANQFRAYVVRKLADDAFGIYVWNSGYSAAYYVYGDPSGVNTIDTDSDVVTTTYYNLQGVRVINPAAGQIVVKVDTLANGRVRTSKVLVR